MKHKLLIFMVCLFTGVSGYAQKQVPLTKALEDLTRIYGTKFSYEKGLLDHSQVDSDIVPKNTQQPIESVLKELLYPKRFLFLYVRKNYYTIVRDNTINQEDSYWRTISGSVRHTDGSPLVGVSVIPEGLGARQGTSTSSDGKFTIRLKHPTEALVFSYIGMDPQRHVFGSSTQIDIVLGVGINQLEEVNVVSTGYQHLPKERATGAFGQVTAKDLKEVPSINILERIEGLLPGVQVDPTTNKITVRGVNTWNSGVESSPLIVIDGFPVMDTEDRRTKLTERVGNTNGGAILSRFNPEDIESITVLKDAAASSIWGANAANGVIVIETKKGKNTPPKISFSTNLSVSAPADLNNLDRMSTADYIELEKEMINKGFIIDTYGDPYNNINQRYPLSQVAEWTFRHKRGQATEMQRDSAINALSQIDNRSQISKYLLQNSVSQQYNVSVSGGSSNTTYMVSANYSNDRPVYRGQTGQSFFLNSSLNTKLFKNIITLSSALNYNYGLTKNNTIASDVMGTSNMGLRPYDLLVDSEGNGIARNVRFRDEVEDVFLSRGYLSWKYNPLEELEANDLSAQANRVRFVADINGRVTDWLNVSVAGQIQRNFENSENINSIDSYEARNTVNYGTTLNTATNRLVYGVPLGGIFNYNNMSTDQYSIRAQINLNKNFGTGHNITWIGGSEIRQNKSLLIADTRYGYDGETFSSATVNPTTPYTNVEGWSSTLGSRYSMSKGYSRALSYYSNAGLSLFSNRYILSGSIRFDDFSLIGVSRDKRAQPLWSLGAKWNVMSESFMQHQDWLDQLGVRITYGVNGTTPTNATPVTVINLSTDNFTNEKTAEITTPGNPQISWEKVYSWNFGLDIGVLNNRLGITFDYYTKNTEDIIASLPYNPTYGFSNLSFNSTTMKGHGIDLGLRAEWIKKQNFSWNTLFNLSYNTNEVTDSRYEKPGDISLISGTSAIVGLPVDYMYAYRWAGLDGSGQSQVYKADGTVVKADQGNNVLTADDLVYVGRKTPPYFGGMMNNIRYKSFTFGARITYNFGGHVFRQSVQTYPQWVDSYNGYKGVIGAQSDLALRWQKEGDEATTNVPGLEGISINSLNRYKFSDLLAIKSGHIRLQQINLGYNFEDKIAQRLGMSNLSVSASVRNLGILWRANKDGVDPQYLFSNNYYNLPPSKSYFLSVNITF